MGLQCGIVGLPNVGKSTLFNALLSKSKAEAENFPFCTIEPNIGRVFVPDERLNIIAQLVEPDKTVPTVIEFVDIAGLVEGASKGEGLGNKFLANIRQVDAIVHVIRCFEDENIVHVNGKIDPVSDKNIINAELQLKDLESVEKRIKKVEKIAKSGDKEAMFQYEVMSTAKQHLEQGKNLRSLVLDEKYLSQLKDLHLITLKPIIYVANTDEESVVAGNKHIETLRNSAAKEKAELIVVSATLEAQISELQDENEKNSFFKEYGIDTSGLDKLIKASYKLLNLITYFTAGKQEVRAWTIKRGDTAPQAAGAIHSDFEKGFIKAEVLKLEDLIELKTELACKEAGKLAIEGKNYVVKDGDIMHFRFNV